MRKQQPVVVVAKQWIRQATKGLDLGVRQLPQIRPMSLVKRNSDVANNAENNQTLVKLTHAQHHKAVNHRSLQNLPMSI